MSLATSTRANVESYSVQNGGRLGTMPRLYND